MFLKSLKNELKEMAAFIRSERREYRDRQRVFSKYQNTIDRASVNIKEYYDAASKVERPKGDSYGYRHLHIAYCLLRGRTYQQIEPKVLPGNEPDWKLINQKVAEGLKELEKEKVAWRHGMKLYVLVRGDLSKSQQAVQAGHAIAEWCRQGYYSNWDGVLIYLKVRDEKELKNYYK